MIIWGILKKQTMRVKVDLEDCGGSVDENWYSGLECKGQERERSNSRHILETEPPEFAHCLDVEKEEKIYKE